MPSKTLRDALGNDMSICSKHALKLAKERNIPWPLLCTGNLDMSQGVFNDVLNRPNNYNWDLSSPRVGEPFSDDDGSKDEWA